MPHCTTNFGWYLGKFLVGFTGMLFFYMVFLKEREYSCLCKARMRDFQRRKGEKPGRCDCRIGLLSFTSDKMRTKLRLCSGIGSRPILAGVRNVLAWCTKIREWFLENDPARISETAFAFEGGLHKNDNDVSLANCVCSMSLLNRKTKLTESNASVRRKRQVRQCLFRHCSGLVCAEKLMRRRRNRQHCVHLRVSQDAVHDYWNVRDKSIQDSIKNKYSPHTRGEDEKVFQQNEEGCCKIEDEERNVSKGNDNCTDEIIPSKSMNKEESELTILKCARVRFNKRCSDQDASRTIEANIAKVACCDKAKLISQCVNEGIPDTLRKGIDLYSIGNIDAPRNVSDEMKRPQRDASFGEAAFTDNCVDSILYRQLRRTCVRSSVKTKPPIDEFGPGVDKTIELKLTPATELERIERISSHLKNVNRTVNNFLDDVRTFSFKQRQEYNLRHSINNRGSSSRLPSKLPSRNIEIARNSQQESISPVSWHKSATSQRFRKYLCQDCYCESKTRNYNDTQWSSGNRKRTSSPRLSPYSSYHPRYRPASPQSHRNDYSLESLRPKRKIDSTVNRKLSSGENRSLRQRISREKPTLVIYKNRRSNVPNSAYSSSSSPRNSSATCRCSTCKSSRYTIQSSDRYKYSGNSTEIESDFLMSSSSSYSCKRCRTCSMLSQNSLSEKRERISSSSCANVRWTGKHGGNEERSSAYLSSTSCTCSVSSLSTFRDDYNSEGTNGEPERIDSRPWTDARCRKLNRKGRLCKDKYHVRWNY